MIPGQTLLWRIISIEADCQRLGLNLKKVAESEEVAVYATIPTFEVREIPK